MKDNLFLIRTTKHMLVALHWRIWRGIEFSLSFLFANQLKFWQTNNAKQQNKQ